jgi:hypothetical protein
MRAVIASRGGAVQAEKSKVPGTYMS